MMDKNLFQGRIGATLCVACVIGAVALLMPMPR